ncbi:hypothetical protein CDAR_519321 [Caerostris darwini]|uniref:Uncharacterized protein n=1 Tax=Caerostris darwini TaxID=1538125 RepID=A0AAV4PPZ0_9ARAC|nr:hypothetical protein CDAR_519321 [Caerostris darwini]
MESFASTYKKLFFYSTPKPFVAVPQGFLPPKTWASSTPTPPPPPQAKLIIGRRSEGKGLINLEKFIITESCIFMLGIMATGYASDDREVLQEKFVGWATVNRAIYAD